MNSISKAILLSAVGLCVNSGNVTYASIKIPDSIPKSGINTLHTHHTQIRHTLKYPNLSSRLFDDSKISGEEQKVASVCFITDTGACSGDKFGNTESPNGGGGGNPDDHGTPDELCQDAGFTNTPCPTGSTIDSYCPYDSSYHTCKCLPEYNKFCNGADEQGSGVACDGKYKECCNLCSAYKYTSIPSGYVSNGECQSCSGKKYKIKCDPQKYVSGSSCGSQGGSGSTCSDDYGTYYQKCNCPNNYEWSDTQKKCVCATSFKYSCTGTGYAGGDGNSCDNKYSKCKCASGYVWNASQGACVCNGLDWCSLNQDCTSLGYAKQSCSGQILRCPFDTSYVYCLDSGKTDSSSDEGNNNPCTHQIYDDCTIEVDMFGSPYSYYVNCWIYEYQCANKTTYPSQCNEIAGTRIKKTSEQVDSSSGYSTQKEATQSAIKAVSGFEGKFISSSLGCK